MKKHLLIIGGSRGSGKVLANLASSQYRVSVVARNEASVGENSAADFFRCDISDFNSTSSMLDEIIQKNDQIDGLTFFQRYRGDGDNWLNEILVSLSSSRNIVEHCNKSGSFRNNASIVFISSVASRYIAEEQPLSYHAAKAAIVQMARYYAVVLGRSHGIRVNCISPAAVIKPENKEFFEREKPLHDFISSKIPLGRMASSEDIAELALFLISEKSSCITGQDLTLDGGLSLLAHEGMLRNIYKEIENA